jgi:hypothetical protein
MSEKRFVSEAWLKKMDQAVQDIAEAEVDLASARASKAALELEIRREHQIRPCESFDGETGEIKLTRDIKKG